MVERLLEGDHRVVAYNRSRDKVDAVVEKGAEGADSLEDLVSKLSSPRVVWVMVPEGAPVTAQIDVLVPLLSEGDVIVDGGNSNFRDSMARGEALSQQGIGFIDAGTSGGVWGLQIGYCLMVGGSERDVSLLEPCLATLAPPDGYLHVGPVGSGHFTKMVHNGIEYSMLQAYAEGFEIMSASQFDIDAAKVSHLWNQGSVVRSWLLELAESAYKKDPDLSQIKGYVEDSGEGRWTVLEAINESVPAPTIAASLFARFASRQEDSYAMRLIAALRNEFGGHAVKGK